MMYEVLSTTSLDIQQSMFKLDMKSNACVALAKPCDVNHPLTHIWRTFSTSRVPICSFPKYFKLVEIGMVQVLASCVEDE
jgi:hypothetical protein